MPAPLFHTNAFAICPHGGKVQHIPLGPRPLVTGNPVATVADAFPIVGCPIQNPCIRVQWVVPTVKFLVAGQPAIHQTSVGLCLNAAQAPQGNAVILSTLSRALVT